MAKDSLADLVAQLGVHSKNEEHDHVLECAKKILKLAPDDISARHSQLVALIKSDKYPQAYKLFSSNTELKKKYPIEFAYTCYKLDKTRDMEELIQSSKTKCSDVDLLHVLAQTYYKQDRSEEAAEVYAKILELDPDSPYRYDIDVNLGSIKANHLLNKPTSGGVSLTNENLDSESYDQLFNLGTAYLAVGRYEEALQSLRDARFASEANESNSKEDFYEESAAMMIQSAYIMQLQGDSKSAKEALQYVEHTGGTNNDLRKVLANNLVSMNEEFINKNPHVLLRELKNIDSTRETLLQKTIYCRNKVVLKTLAGLRPLTTARKLSDANKLSVGAEIVAQVSESVLKGEESPINHALLKQLTDRYKKTPTTALSMLIAQLYSLAERYKAASSTLESLVIKEGHYKPGIVGALSSLYKLRHLETEAWDLLDSAVEKWTANADDSVYYAASLLTESSDQKHIDRAMRYFKTLAEKVEDKSIMTAGLIAAGADVEVSGAYLKDVAKLTENIDAQSLVEDGVQALIQKRPASAAVVDSQTENGSATKKRKTKAKLPKDYDPEKQPDPERWLPKRDRSTWRPKKKDKKNAKVTTQGGAVDNTTETVTHVANAVKFSKPKSNNNNKKKKKKGK